MPECGESCANVKVDPLKCKFCRSEGLSLLPLRYGTVGADDMSVLAAVPGLGALGNKVKDKTLKHSKYTVRLLRPGYLYTLEDRNGGLRWIGYKINSYAQLFQFDIDKPAPESDQDFKCETRPCAATAATATVMKPEEVQNLYLLYTVDPMSQEKLDEYKANRAAYAGEGKLQVIHPNQFAANPAQHTIKPAELSNHVLEYWLYQQSEAKRNIHTAPYAEVLKDQLFPPFVYGGDTAATVFARLGRVRAILAKTKGAGIVLFDPVGITQELNNFRNAAFDRIDTFLAETDKSGIDNERKFIVSQKIEELRTAIEAGVIGEYDAKIDNELKRKTKQLKDIDGIVRQNQSGAVTNTVANVDTFWKQERVRKEQYFDERIARLRQQGQHQATQKWKEKYEPRIDRAEINAFLKALSQVKTEALQTADQRATDHIAWLGSPELINAFDTYRRGYSIPTSAAGISVDAYGFSAQADLSFFGIDGSRAYDQLLDRWLGSLTIERDNLFFRSYCYNHEAIERALKTSFANAKKLAAAVDDPAEIGSAAMVGAFKGFINLMKDYDSAFDEWDSDRQQKPDFATKALDRHVFFKTAMLTRAVFRKGLGGSFDKTLIAALGGATYARLGKLTETLAWQDLQANTENRWSYARKQAQAKNYGRRVDGTLYDVLRDARQKAQVKIAKSLDDYAKTKQSNNNFHHARISVLLGTLESLALAGKLKDFKDDPRAYLEITASIFTLASIAADLRDNALETIGGLSEFEKRKGRNGKALKRPFKTQGAKYVNGAVDIQRGAWKLASGGMAGAAGGISALLDGLSARDEWNKKNTDPFLFSIYVARTGAGGYAAWLSLKIGFSYTAPLLARAGLKQTAQFVADKLAQRVGMLLWFARFNAIGLAFTAAELLYLWLKDDAFQNWLDQCTFRKEKIAESALTKYSFSVIRATYVTDSYETLERELDELYEAFKEVG